MTRLLNILAAARSLREAMEQVIGKDGKKSVTSPGGKVQRGSATNSYTISPTRQSRTLESAAEAFFAACSWDGEPICRLYLDYTVGFIDTNSQKAFKVAREVVLHNTSEFNNFVEKMAEDKTTFYKLEWHITVQF